MVKLFANSGDLDQTSHSAASDLRLQCLPVNLLGVSRLQWVNVSLFFILCLSIQLMFLLLSFNYVKMVDIHPHT